MKTMNGKTNPFFFCVCVCSRRILSFNHFSFRREFSISFVIVYYDKVLLLEQQVNPFICGQNHQ